MNMNPEKTIAIAGATGLIGSHLTKHFKSKKWEVIPLGRKDFGGSLEALAEKIETADVVINLAGAPVIKRWTKEHKKEIYNSRILTTRKLVEAIELVKNKPELMISASAVGIYDQECVQDEHSNQFAGDFLSKVCMDWEAEAEKVSAPTRLAIIRIGIVLAREGGALKTMLPIFKLGIGGKIATGRQPFSWIHIADVVNAIEFIIQDPECKGVFNFVAPGLINNRQFTAALSKAIRRPALLFVPSFALRLLYGKAAVTLTTGQKVVPMRLEKAAYDFKFKEINKALENLF
jgi:uncharacterized protein (TIGR01777 family)